MLRLTDMENGEIILYNAKDGSATIRLREREKLFG